MYISLLILFLCVGGGFAQNCTEANNFETKCEIKKHVLLLNTSNSQDINYFKTFSDDVEVIDDICPGGVQGLIAATERFPNCYIVNLNVPDFYTFNYNKVSQHLIFGGDRNYSQRVIEACVVKPNTPNIICNKNARRKFSYPPVKLMSANVENYIELYNAVLTFSGKSHVKKHERKAMSNFFILICTEDEPNEDFNFKGIDIKFSTHCEEDVQINQNYVLAVVTAKPLEIYYDIMVPIILYQAPCYDESVSKIHNYVTMTNCDHYKVGLLEFLKSIGWTRVALVSDNEAYSEKFEREVRTLFDENQFSYTVVKCHETRAGGCNFIEALESLKDSDGRVFIANMDENNTRILQKQASQVWTRHNSLSSWIFRGFMLKGDTEAMGDVYSLFLDTANKHPHHNMLRHHINDDIQYKNSIISAIEMIHVAYKNIWSHYNETERELSFSKQTFKNLTHEIRKQLSSNAKVNVHLKNQREVYTTITIEDGKVTTLDKRQRRREDMIGCSLRRNDYQNPCDDNNLLNIMIALVVIASCGLVAAICYNRFDMNTRRYRNLE